MGNVIIKKEGFKCERCGYEWIPHDIKQIPVTCPKCKSPYWDKPKTRFLKKDKLNKKVKKK